MASICLSVTPICAASPSRIVGATSARARSRTGSYPLAVSLPGLVSDHRRMKAKLRQVVCMAPDEERLTRRNPLNFPAEWERSKPGRRIDRALRFVCFSHPISQQPNSTLLSAKPRSSLLEKHPLLSKAQQNVSSQVREKILCLEIMGVNAGKALSLNPSLLAVSLHSIESIIDFLQSKGLRQKDLPRIFGMCPRILTSDINSDLNPVFNFLRDDLKVPDRDFRRVINKCPRLLVSSVPDQLKPVLFYLQRLGLRDLRALAYQDPILLVCSVENTLIRKLKFLESLGLSRDEVVGMVLRFSALLTYSIENNFMPKFEYFSVEMEGKVEELREFPQYFAFSLEKRIKPRHMEMVQSGVKVPLAVMLKSTDDEFRELLK